MNEHQAMREFGRLLVRRVNKVKKQMMRLPTPATGEAQCIHKILHSEINELIALTSQYPVRTEAKYAISSGYPDGSVVLLRHSGSVWVEVSKHGTNTQAMEAMEAQRRADQLVEVKS